MGLLDLQTDLKSLKYGQDRPNGGSSGQPYIQTDIRTVDATFGGANLTLYDDGLVRGGMVAAQNAAATDTLRIAKFFTDPPKGPLFLVKQVGLQLSNPQLERKGDTTERYVGSSRIYNLGINTLAQVPLTAFGEHIVRHGLLPVNDPDTYYESVVTANNLRDDSKNNRLLKLLNRVIDEPSQTVINKYVGGPGSTYGIGNTLLLRAETPTDNGTLLIITNNSAGQPLVDGQRQPFTYINPDTYNGAVSSGLGQRNKRSQKNKTQHIGGVEYSNRGLTDIFYNTITDPNELAKAVDQSVYSTTSNPTSQSLQNSSNYTKTSRATKDTVKITKTSDFGISNLSGSIYNGGKTFNLINFGGEGGNTTTINDNTSFLYFDAKKDDKPGLVGGLSRETTDTIKTTSTVDYELSNRTKSVFSDRSFTDLPTQIVPNQPIPFFTASNSNTGSHSRDPGLPTIDNNNDLVKDGPSSYPLVSNSGLKQLDLEQTVYNFTNPNLKKYSSISTEIAKQTSKGTPLIHTNTGLPGKYQYNTGTKLVFNRVNDREVAKDTLAIVFKPVDPFSGGFLSTLSFLAYLKDYKDTFDSTWNDIKYVGRAEKFYIFNEFKRSISFSFTIPCFNRNELTAKHNLLNKLVSITAGVYNGKGLLGGVITYLTLGNYIANQPGIITSIGFNPVDQSSWDLDAKLAFYIDVSVSFTLIHSFLPEYNRPFINVPGASKTDPTYTQTSATSSAVPVNTPPITTTTPITPAFNTFVGPVAPTTPTTQTFNSFVGPTIPTRQTTPTVSNDNVFDPTNEYYIDPNNPYRTDGSPNYVNQPGYQV